MKHTFTDGLSVELVENKSAAMFHLLFTNDGDDYQVNLTYIEMQQFIMMLQQLLTEAN